MEAHNDTALSVEPPAEAGTDGGPQVQHVGEYRCLFALNASPDGRVFRTLTVARADGTGMFTDYVQARSINLVKRGMIVLALEWVGQGQLNTSGYQHRTIRQRGGRVIRPG